MNDFDTFMKQAMKNAYPEIKNLKFKLQETTKSSEDLEIKENNLKSLKVIKIFENKTTRLINEIEEEEEFFLTLFYGEFTNILEIRNLEDGNKVIEAINKTHKEVKELINKAEEKNILNLKIFKKQRLTFKDYEEMINHFKRNLEITEDIYSSLESLEDYKNYIDNEEEKEKITKYVNYKRMLEKFPNKKNETTKRGKI